MNTVVVSDMDKEHLAVIRANVTAFMRHVGATYGTSPGLLLDIAPQIHDGARPFFLEIVTVETLDINSEAGCTYVGDICEQNLFLPDGRYQYIVCTEVLEHTLRPWDAVVEIRRLLAPGGILFISVPFNFRIHGPLPDCWRFTEHGLRALLQGFEILEIDSVETPGRTLMPIHYTVVARKLDETSSIT